MNKKILYTNDYPFIANIINEERRTNGESTLNDEELAEMYNERDKAIWNDFRTDFEEKFDKKCPYGAIIVINSNQQTIIIENGVMKDNSNSVELCHNPFECLKVLMNHPHIEIDDVDGKLILVGEDNGVVLQGEIRIITKDGQDYLDSNKLTKEFISIREMTMDFNFSEDISTYCSEN